MSNEALTLIATAGVTAAKDAALLVMAGLTVYYASIYGVKKIYSLITGNGFGPPEIDESFMTQEMARSRSDGASPDGWGGYAYNDLGPPVDDSPFIDSGFADTRSDYDAVMSAEDDPFPDIEHDFLDNDSARGYYSDNRVGY